MAVMKKKEEMGECCGRCGCCGKICGWFLLVWGLLFLAFGLNYLQSIDFLKGISGWTIFGVGIAVMGLYSLLHGMMCGCCK